MSLEEAYRENRRRLASSARPDLSGEFIWPNESRERRRLKMLANKVRVDGHYEATRTPWATDYVWVPSEEVVNERHLYEVLHPWHAAYAEWVIEERAHPEEQQRMEMETL